MLHSYFIRLASSLLFIVCCLLFFQKDSCATQINCSKEYQENISADEEVALNIFLYLVRSYPEKLKDVLNYIYLDKAYSSAEAPQNLIKNAYDIITNLFFTDFPQFLISYAQNASYKEYEYSKRNYVIHAYYKKAHFIDLVEFAQEFLLFGDKASESLSDIPLLFFTNKQPPSLEELQRYCKAVTQSHQLFKETLGTPRFFTNATLNTVVERINQRLPEYEIQKDYLQFLEQMQSFKQITQAIYLEETKQTLWEQFKQELQNFKKIPCEPYFLYTAEKSDNFLLCFLFFALDLPADFGITPRVLYNAVETAYWGNIQKLDRYILLGLNFDNAYSIYYPLENTQEKNKDMVIWSALAGAVGKYQFALYKLKPYETGEIRFASLFIVKSVYMLLKGIEKSDLALVSNRENFAFIEALVGTAYGNMHVLPLNTGLWVRLSWVEHHSEEEFVNYRYIGVPLTFNGKKIDVKAVQQAILREEQKLDWLNIVGLAISNFKATDDYSKKLWFYEGNGVYAAYHRIHAFNYRPFVYRETNKPVTLTLEQLGVLE